MRDGGQRNPSSPLSTRRIQTTFPLFRLPKRLPGLLPVVYKTNDRGDFLA